MTTAATLVFPAASAPATERPLSVGDRALVERLRACARAAQLAAPMDPFHACALIAPPAGREAHVYGVALMRTLGRALDRRLAFHQRGAAVATIGERWLLSLLRAIEAGDAASAMFLAARWVRRTDRRAILFLAQRLVSALPG